jgi:Domain of unknown function (DUF6456)
MSTQRIERALAHLAKAGAVLAQSRDGVFGVYPRGDRRRRPAARLNAGEVKALESEGVVVARDEGEGFVLGEAGVARVRRQTAQAGEAFIAQHADVVDRSVADGEGEIRIVRGLDPDGVMRRLVGLRGATGRRWLDNAELAAASQLRRDWATAQIGMVRGSDWTAAPLGATPRGGANAQEVAMARRCDARRRVAEALDRLAPPLRRAVERVCLHEVWLEVLERTEAWPSRSGKLALKLGLAQLAANL